jgi:cysteinyl-tRNA synthetase
MRFTSLYPQQPLGQLIDDGITLMGSGKTSSFGGQSLEIPKEFWDEVIKYWQAKLDASISQVVVPEEIYEIVCRRQQARSQSDWSQTDNLREDLAGKGWKVVDSPDGPQFAPITQN